MKKIVFLLPLFLLVVTIPASATHIGASFSLGSEKRVVEIEGGHRFDINDHSSLRVAFLYRSLPSLQLIRYGAGLKEKITDTGESRFSFGLGFSRIHGYYKKEHYPGFLLNLSLEQKTPVNGSRWSVTTRFEFPVIRQFSGNLPAELKEEIKRSQIKFGLQYNFGN